MGTALPFIQIGLAVMGTAMSMQAAKAEGDRASAMAEHGAKVSRNNAILAQRSADDARKRGELEAAQQGRETAALIGKQRASIAGSGVDVAGVDAVKITTDTAAIGRQDALTIANNAEREALGFEARRANFESAANAGMATSFNAKSIGLGS